MQGPRSAPGARRPDVAPNPVRPFSTDDNNPNPVYNTNAGGEDPARGSQSAPTTPTTAPTPPGR